MKRMQKILNLSMYIKAYSYPNDKKNLHSTFLQGVVHRTNHKGPIRCSTTLWAKHQASSDLFQILDDVIIIRLL